MGEGKETKKDSGDGKAFLIFLIQRSSSPQVTAGGPDAFLEFLPL